MAKTPKPTIDKKPKTPEEVEDAVVLDEAEGEGPEGKSAETDLSAPEPENTSQDEPQPEQPAKTGRTGGGFMALILGGMLAAGIGFVAARYVVPEGWPFPGVAPAVDPVAEAVQDHKARLAALQSQAETQAKDLAVLKADPQLEELQGTVRGEFGVLQTRLQDFANRLDALDDRLVTVEKIPQGSGTAAAESAAAAYERELAEMRAMLDSELARISTAQSDTQSLEANAAAAAKAAAGRAAMARILAALDTGQPFDDALFDLGEVTGVAAPDALAALAKSGAPTLNALQSSFPDAARDALGASIRAAVQDGSMSRATAFLRTQLGTRSLEPREGNDPDAILSRAEAALRNGQIQATVTELAQIPPAGQLALADWITQANSRVGALTAGEDLARQLNSN